MGFKNRKQALGAGETTAARGKAVDATERIRFITHRGKQILFVDLSYCSPAELEETVHRVPDVVTAQPPGSLLLLADFTQASFSKEAIRTMKENAVFDKAFIKKTAWIGTESLPASFHSDISKYSRREFPTFRTRNEALEWLTQE